MAVKRFRFFRETLNEYLYDTFIFQYVLVSAVVTYYAMDEMWDEFCCFAFNLLAN